MLGSYRVDSPDQYKDDRVVGRVRRAKLEKTPQTKGKNGFGGHGTLCAGVTMDQRIVRLGELSARREARVVLVWE